MRDFHKGEQGPNFDNDETSTTSNNHSSFLLTKNVVLPVGSYCSVLDENDSSSSDDELEDSEDEIEEIELSSRSDEEDDDIYWDNYQETREESNRSRKGSIKNIRSKDKKNKFSIHDVVINVTSEDESYCDLTSSDEDDQSSLSEELMSQSEDDSLHKAREPAENDTLINEFDDLVCSIVSYKPVQTSEKNILEDKGVTKDSCFDDSKKDNLDPDSTEKLPPLINNGRLLENTERENDLEAHYHLAVEHLVHKRFQFYLDLIDRYPKIVSVYSKNLKYQTILHKLAKLKHTVPDDVVLKTLSYDPSIIAKTDDGENTALHYAAAAVHAGNYSTFRVILNSHSICASVRNKVRNLPLHLAAANSKPGAQEAVRELFNAYPKGVKSSNQKGQLPLHLACISGINNSSIVGILLSMHKLNMSDIAILDRKGNSPLHAGIKNGCSFSTISAFNHEARDSFLNAYIQKDSSGDVPLHSALRRKDVDSRIILSLIQVAPFTGGIPTKDGSMPIQLATESSRGGDIIEALLATDLPLELGNNRKRQFSDRIVHRRHGHSWWHIAIECGEKYLNLLIDFLSKKATFPQIISLAFSLGPDGETTTKQAAGSELTKMFQKLLRILGRYQILTEKINFSDDVAIQSYHAIDHADPIKQLDNGSGQTRIEEKSSRNYMLSSGYTAIMSETGIHSTESETEVAYLPWQGKGKEVTLRLFEFVDDFENEINLRNKQGISDDFVERILNVHKSRDDDEILCKFGKHYDCIAFERKTITLSELLEERERENLTVSQEECFTIIKNVALALNHIHNHGFVHGRLNPSNVSLYGYKWKLMEIGMAIPIGQAMNGSIQKYSPPESFHYGVESILNLSPSSLNKRHSKTNKSSKPSEEQSFSRESIESIETVEATSRWGLKKKKNFLSKFTMSCINENSVKCVNKNIPPNGDNFVENKRNHTKKAGCFGHGCITANSFETSSANNRIALCNDSKAICENSLCRGTKQCYASELDTDQNLTFGSVQSSPSLTNCSTLSQEREIMRLKKALENQDEMYRNLLSSKKINIKRRETHIQTKTKVIKNERVCFAPEKVMASPSWDLWSLGVIMSRLIIGETPHLPTFEETIENFQDQSIGFSNEQLKAIRDEVNERAGDLAANLIYRLLQPNPSNRISSAFQVLEHKYFLSRPKKKIKQMYEF